MDTISHHEDSDSGHSWLTLDEELSEKEDNDSEINALPSDEETDERREWMKEQRSHPDRPKDEGRSPHSDRPIDRGRRPLTDRLKDDARRPRSNRPKDGGRRSHIDLPKDDTRRPHPDRPKDDTRRPYPDRPKDDGRRPHPDRPKDDGRRFHTDRPKDDARRPNNDRPKDAARRPHNDRSKDEARRPHSNRSKDEGRRSHNEGPKNDARRPHSDRPKDEGRISHSDRPNDGGRRPHTGRLMNDVRRPHPDRPKDDDRRPQTDRPKDDGRRPYSDRPKDEGRRPHTDRSKDDGGSTDQELSQNKVQVILNDFREPEEQTEVFQNILAPSSSAESKDPRESMKEQGSHVDRLKDSGRSNDKELSQNKVQVILDDFREPEEQTEVFQNILAPSSSAESKDPRESMKEQGSHVDRLKDSGRSNDKELSLHKVQGPLDHFREPEEQTRVFQNSQAPPSGVESKEPLEWMKEQISFFDCQKDGGRSNDQELSLIKVQVSLDHFRDPEKETRQFRNVQALSSGGESEERREWMEVQRSNFDFLNDDGRNKDQQLSLNKVPVPLVIFRKLKDKRTLLQNPPDPPSGVESEEPLKWMKEQRSYFDIQKDGGRSNDQESSLNKVHVPLAHFSDIEEQTRVFQSPQALPSGGESKEPREWSKEQRSYFDFLKDDSRNKGQELFLNEVQVPLVHFRELKEQKSVLRNLQALPSSGESEERKEVRYYLDCRKDGGQRNDQELSLSKVQVPLDHFRDSEEQTKVFQNPQALPSGEERRELLKEYRSYLDCLKDGGQRNDEEFSLSKVQVPLDHFRDSEERTKVFQNPQALPSGEERRELLKEYISYLDCIKDGGQRNDQELSLSKVQVPLDHFRDSEEQTKVFQNPQALPSGEERREWLKEHRSYLDCLKDGGQRNDQELSLNKLQVPLDHFRDSEEQTRVFQNPQALPSGEERREWLKEHRSYLDCPKDGGQRNDQELSLSKVQVPLDHFRDSKEQTRAFQNPQALRSGEERREWLKEQRSYFDCLKDGSRSNDQKLSLKKVQVPLHQFRDSEEQTRVFQNPQALPSGEERREWLKEVRSYLERLKDGGRSNDQSLNKVLDPMLDHFPNTELQNEAENEERRESTKEQIPHLDRPNDDGGCNGLELSPNKVQDPVLDPFLDPEMQKRVFQNFLRTVRRRAQYQKNLAGGAVRNINSSEAILNPQPSVNSIKGLAGTQSAQISEIPSLSTDSPVKPHPHQQTPFAVYLVPLTYPRDYLKQDQFESLSLQILSEIDALPVGGKVAPKFNTAKLYHGSCLLNCADEETRKWVLELLPQLKAGQFELSSVTSTQLFHYVKAVAFIPGPPCSSDLIIKRLWTQNPGLVSDIWTVHQMTNNSEGSMVRLTFPETLVPALEKEKFKLCYGMDQIQLRLWKKKKSQPSKSAQEANDIPSVAPVAGRTIEPNVEINCTFGYNELSKYEPGGRDEDLNSEGEQPMDLDD